MEEVFNKIVSFQIIQKEMLCNDVYDIYDVNILVDSFKYLRNYVVRNEENLEKLLLLKTPTGNIIDSSFSIISYFSKFKFHNIFMDSIEINLHVTETIHKALASAIVQFLCNICVSGYKYVFLVWQINETIWLSQFMDVIVYCVQSKSINGLKAFLAMIHASIIKDKQEYQDMILLRICHSKELLSQILLAIVTISTNIQVSDTLPTGSLVFNQDNNELLEWYHILFIELWGCNQLASIFTSINLNKLDERILNHEQVILMRLCQQIFDDPSSRNNASNVINTTKDIIIAINQTIDVKDISLDNAVEIENNFGQIYNAECILICLETIASALSLFDSPEGSEMKTYLGHSKLLNICKDILLKHSNVTNKASSFQSSFSRKQQIDFQLIGVTLRLLANLVHRCTNNQNLIREMGILKLVLSRITANINVPLAREWALLCIRNSCEECPRNQEYIDSLKPKQGITDAILKARNDENEN